MSTGIEQELRALFRDKAGEAPVTTPDVAGSASRPVLRRARLRQVATVAGSAAIACALVVGAVAGLNALLRGGDRDVGRGYDVFERTATIEAFTVTSPSDWYFVDHWPAALAATYGSTSASGACTIGPSGDQACVSDPAAVDPIHPPPYGLPILQLSNTDLGLDGVACRDGLPATTAILYVGYLQANVGPAGSGLKPFPPAPGLPEPTDGPCGRGSYAEFTVNGHAMVVWVGLGPDVSDEDRAVVQTAYERMSADDRWEPTPTVDSTPAYVIAGGGLPDGSRWRLDLRPGQRSPELVLEGVEPSHSMGVTEPAAPIAFCCPTTDGLSDATLLGVTFGFVREDASGVELQVREEDEFTGQVLPGVVAPVPPSLGPFGFDLFFIPGTAGLSGQVVPIGIDGSVEPPPLEEPRDEVVELSGSLEGQDWTVRFFGTFDGRESPCIEISTPAPVGHLCPDPLHATLAGPTPYLVGVHRPDLYLLVGSVPPAVEQIRFAGDDDAIVPQQVRCAMGPLGWTDPDRMVCAIALPPSGSGTLRYLGAAGDVAFEEGIGWDAAAPGSNRYPWTNEDSFITARGSFQGAGWKLEVLHYLDGYRLTVDGRVVFEGRPSGLAEAKAFPLFEGGRAGRDALVLIPTTERERSASIVTADRTWEGRWIPGSTVSGGKGRLWVFEMPGSGTGTYWLNGDSVQGEISWP
ncbi:MAG TPA: hypothetical protein VFQ40_05325 [Actinomycetota bacterium]|nr:hypothetical protein [Actinomycetota bacterium]